MATSIVYQRYCERSLVVLAQEGRGSAREELIERFLPAIGGVARQYRNTAGVDRRELAQEGVVGLLRALERFDVDARIPFWAYAKWWVRQAMQHLVSELGRPVVLSDRAQRQLARVRDARRAHLQAVSAEPTVDELTARTGFARRQVENLLAVERAPRALEEPVGTADAGLTLRDVLPDPEAEDVYEDVPRHLALAQLPAMLEELSDRERAVVRSRFGLDGEVRTLREVADAVGVSAERVRQIEKASIRKLGETYRSGPSVGSAA